MISKEEAKQKYANIINSDPLAALIINELIEEYEQQVCENCKYDDEGYVVCKASIPRPALYSLKQFGCNKFQCK